MNAPHPTALEVNRSRAHAALLAGQCGDRRAHAARTRSTVSAGAEHPVAARRCAARPGPGRGEHRGAGAAAGEGAGVRQRPRGAGTRLSRARAAAAGARAGAGGARSAMPHHHLAWLAYGDALVDLGQYADAVTAYERARLTDPQRAAHRGGDRRTGGRGPQGLPRSIFRQILQANPSHVAALCGLAAVSLAADKPHDAERLLRHALEQSRAPAAGPARAGPGAGGPGQAERMPRGSARSLLKIEPENPQTWITLGGVATRLMRQEEALEAYEHAARLTPNEVRLAPVDRPRAQDAGAPPGQRGRLPGGPGDAAGNGRGLLVAGGPEELHLQRRRDRRTCRRLVGGERAPRRRGAAALRARRAPSSSAPSIRAPSPITRAATPCVAWTRRSTSTASNSAPRASAAFSTAAYFRRAQRRRRPGRRPDLHRRPAAFRLDADRADPGQPLAAWRAPWSCRTSSTWCTNSRTRRPTATATRRRSPARAPEVLRALGARYLEETAPLRHRTRPFHGQAAEQLQPHRPDPVDPAERHPHRCAPPPAGLLLQHLQAVLCRGADLQLRPRRTWAATTAAIWR